MRGKPLPKGLIVTSAVALVLVLLAGFVVYLGTIEVKPETVEVVIPNESFPK
ncbi:MAG: hypothetical protein H6923_06295 [Alphaproteobacteria bacterium]|nr:hypothetical protein [Alphaproteobacteria bacterium]